MSPARRLSVLPSVMISVRERGTSASLRRSISACIRALPALVSRPVGVDNVLVDAPGDFEGDVLVAGKQVEYLVLLA